MSEAEIVDYAMSNLDAVCRVWAELWESRPGATLRDAAIEHHRREHAEPARAV